jgi:GT2 family glycosyltransferase
MSRFSIIIISWNAQGYLRNCLKSIAETSGSLVWEVIVVDNASRDGSPEMVEREFPEVKLIRAGENLGFARANNLGLAQSTGEFIALVNSDVIVHPECFHILLEFFEQHQDVGLAGPKVFGRDGKIQKTCGRLPTVLNTASHFFGFDKAFPRLPLFRGFQMSENEHTSGCAVETLSGCFCVARKLAVQQVGGLDESFFFYAEDIDWSKRFADRGWKLAYVADATITHFGGGSSSNAPLKYTIEMLRANLTYWRKHHGIIGSVSFFFLAFGQHSIRFLARGIFIALGQKPKAANKEKLREHLHCIRWLLTRKEI